MRRLCLDVARLVSVIWKIVRRQVCVRAMIIRLLSLERELELKLNPTITAGVIASTTGDESGRLAEHW